MQPDPNHSRDGDTHPESLGVPSIALPRTVGDYELLEEAARGGMGVVYRARQISLGRQVAVKVVLEGSFASAEQFRRFRLEAEQASKIKHQAVVSIHHVGEIEGRPFFSMDWIEGKRLDQYVESKPQDPTRALMFGLEIADALVAIHREGVIHRDLKPGNIVIDGNGRVIIVDFGLAKSEDQGIDFTTMGDVLGTPAYMSPEQAAGRSSTASFTSDIYSFGAILYFLLSGRPPFVGATPGIVLRQVEEREPIALRTLVPEVPKDLATVVHQCLQKNPERRYATAQLLQADLERAERSEPILARSPGVAERCWRWCKRRPAVAGLAAALAVVLSFTIIWGGNQLGETRVALADAEASRTRTLVARVEALQSATPAAAESQLASFSPEDLLAVRPELDALLSSKDLTDHQRQRLSLLQMSIAPISAYPQMKEAIASIEDPAEILLSRKVLKAAWPSLEGAQRDALVQQLETEVEEGRAGSKRLRAAGWLAALKPDSQAWEGIESFLVTTLVTEPPLRFPLWLDCLEPASDHLLPTTLARLKNERIKDVRREGEIIAKWSKAQPRRLVEALLEAPVEALPPLVAALQPHLKTNQSIRAALEQAAKVQPFSLRAELSGQWTKPSAEALELVENAVGEVHEHCAWALKVDPSKLDELTRKLGEFGYRPIQTHFWRDQEAKAFLSTTWLRDGKAFRVKANCKESEAYSAHAQFAKDGFSAKHLSTWKDEGGLTRFAVLWEKGGARTRLELDLSLDSMNYEVQLSNRTGEEPISVNYRAGSRDSDYAVSIILGQYWRDPNLFFSAARPYAMVASGAHPGRSLSDLEYLHGPRVRRERYEVLRGDFFKKRVAYVERLGINRSNKAEFAAFVEQVRREIDEKDVLLGYCLDFREMKRVQGRYDLLQEMIASPMPMVRQWAQMTYSLFAARVGDPDIEPLQDLAAEVGMSSLLKGLTFVAESKDPRPVLKVAQGDNAAETHWGHAQIWAAQAYIEEKRRPGLSRQASLQAMAAIKACLSLRPWTVKQQEEVELNLWWSTVRDCPEWDALAPRYGIDLWCGVLWCSVDNEETKFVELLTPTEISQTAPERLANGWCCLSANVMPDGPDLRASMVWVRPRTTATMRRAAHQRRANAALALAAPSLIGAFGVEDAGSQLLLQISNRARRLGLGAQELSDAMHSDSPRTGLQMWALLCTLAGSSLEELSPQKVRQLSTRLAELVAQAPPTAGVDGHGGGVRAAADLALRRLKESSVWPDEASATLSLRAPRFVTVDMRKPFMRGSMPGERGRSYYEERQRTKIGRLVRVATAETTVGEFAEFIRAYPREHDGHKDRGVGDPNLPVMGIRITDAMKYCRWLSEKEGIPESEMCYGPVDTIKLPIRSSDKARSRRGYRLMTEAEHEFMSKQGGNDDAWFGTDPAVTRLSAWSLMNSGNSRQPVMTRLPSPWGVSDLFGNVLEYCDGDWSKQLDDSAPSVLGDLPKRVPVGPNTPIPLRGSSFNHLGKGYRATRRFAVPVGKPIRNAGFRIVQTLSTTP